MQGRNKSQMPTGRSSRASRAKGCKPLGSPETQIGSALSAGIAVREEPVSVIEAAYILISTDWK